MVKAVYDHFGKNLHIPCFAHTLNLVVDNSTTKCEEFLLLLNKVRDIVKYFKRSTAACDELRRLQIFEGNLNILDLEQSTLPPYRAFLTFFFIDGRYLRLGIFFNSCQVKLFQNHKSFDKNIINKFFCRKNGRKFFEVNSRCKNPLEQHILYD